MAAKAPVTRRALRSWEAKWSLRAPEPFEEPAGVALALRRDGVQESGFDHTGLHAGPCQALDALIEERPSQGLGLLGTATITP